MTYTSYSQDEELNRLNHGIKSVELRYTSILDQFEKKELSNDSLRGSLNVLIQDLDSLIAISTTLNKKMDKLNNSLTALGPVPEEGAPKEAKNVSNRRNDLNVQISQLKGYLINTNDLILAIEKLRTDISNYRTSESLSGITVRTVSLYSKVLWTSCWNEYKSLKKIIYYNYQNFQKVFLADKKWGGILLLIVSALFSIAILRFPFSPFGKRIDSTIKIKSKNPHLSKRLELIVPPAIKSTLIFAALGIMYLSFTEIHPLSPKVSGFLKQMILWFTLVAFIWGFAKRLFAPNVLLWHGIICAPGKEQGNRLLFTGMLYAYIIDTILTSLFELFEAVIYISVAQSIMITSIFAVFLFIFFTPKRWVLTSKNPQNGHNENATSQSNNNKQKGSSINKKLVANEILFFIGRAIAVLIVLTIAFEYVKMANFLFQRLVILTLLYILFTSARTMTHWIILGLTKHSQVSGYNSVNSVERKTSLDFWLNTALDAILIVLTVPAVLFAIGIDWIDIHNWIQLFLDGIEIGGITVSFRNIFNGLFTFFIIIIAFRWSTSVISKRLKEYTNLNSGVRNSIVTLLNYAGVVVALLTAIPMLGFNFSNITVIAGALSVGIGFGLQNIVKDFISGLILLIDRPVKLGDWVVLKSGQGYVKEIKSRVTIIQTFDRSKIIVPNSELVTFPMINWFYGNKQGRVRVKVGVAYSSDPEKVREVLLKCAHDHSSILDTPKPYVIWEDFGDSSLDFELRSYVSNSDYSYRVRSDLRFSIYKSLKEEGISIPFPQRDLHISGATLNPTKQELGQG